VIVIKHHRAAAGTYLRVSVRENDSDQAHVHGKGRIDVFVKNLGNPGHGGIVAEVECLSMALASRENHGKRVALSPITGNHRVDFEKEL
jgi:hypothetical protein